MDVLSVKELFFSRECVFLQSVSTFLKLTVGFAVLSRQYRIYTGLPQTMFICGTQKSNFSISS